MSEGGLGPPFFVLGHNAGRMTGDQTMRSSLLALAVGLSGSANALAQAASVPAPLDAASGPIVAYRCPGNVFTNQITPAQARERGCRPVEGTPITVVQMPRPRAATPSTPGARNGDLKVDPNAQRERDNDARRILEAELRREEEKLATLKREYNNGEPERLGSERNYQTYLDRVSSLRAAITRSESDIAALKRELAKIQP
jgi:hypothetical protein